MTINKHDSGTTYDTSCNGKLIDCDYYIQARFVPDICCNCNGDPTVRFPVHMTVPQVENQMFQPDGWGQNVQQMQPFVANFSPEYAMMDNQVPPNQEGMYNQAPPNPVGM